MSGRALLLGCPACRDVCVQLMNSAELLLFRPVVPCGLYSAESNGFASLKIKNMFSFLYPPLVPFFGPMIIMIIPV